MGMLYTIGTWIMLVPVTFNLATIAWITSLSGPVLDLLPA